MQRDEMMCVLDVGTKKRTEITVVTVGSGAGELDHFCSGGVSIFAPSSNLRP